MEYQINAREAEVEVGREEELLLTFEKAGRFIYNLEATFEGLAYQMKLPAPWTGFRWRLTQNDQELASAKKQRIRSHEAIFELRYQDRALRLQSADELGLRFVLIDEEECGDLTLRPFDKKARWRSDLRVPEAWPVPLAAFVGWVAAYGRGVMNA